MNQTEANVLKGIINNAADAVARGTGPQVVRDICKEVDNMVVQPEEVVEDPEVVPQPKDPEQPDPEAPNPPVEPEADPDVPVADAP